MWPWRVKMPTQNLLRLLLLLMLMLRIMLATICYRFESWRLVLKLNFCSDFEHKVGQDFEVEVQARVWSWSLFSILPLMFWRGNHVWSRFWILSLVEMLMFCWCWVKILKMKFDQRLCLNLQYDFGKMNSTLGSVVPLAMFVNLFGYCWNRFVDGYCWNRTSLS